MADWLQARGLLRTQLDPRGRTMLDAATTAGGPNKKWAQRYDTFIGRYTRDERAAYYSPTCEVWHAIDRMDGDAEVALKLLNDRGFFCAEVDSRGGSSTDFVLPIKHVHVPLGCEMGEAWPVADEHSSDSNFIIVMEWCSRSLDEVIATEQIAGRDLQAVSSVARHHAAALQHLHELGFVHGDAKPKNFMRLLSGEWRLIDLDAAVKIGSATSTKYSEAYIAPEMMREQLSNRDWFPSSRRENRQHAPITAHTSLDLWTFGVVLYELCTGRHLWAKDINTDCCAHKADCHHLACWSEMWPEMRAAVFPHESITNRLLAIDALSQLLAANPADRPASMLEVLQHPFFTGRAVAFPRVPRHPGTLDVIFSYQTHNFGLLARVRRCLKTLGLSTVDGSVVPPGSDWRAWYFGRLEEATCFVAIVSQYSAASKPCGEEITAARAMSKPVIGLLVDGHSHGVELGANCAERKPFEADFWASLSQLATEIVTQLPVDDRWHCVLLCDGAVSLAQEISSCLGEMGYRVVICSGEGEILDQLLSGGPMTAGCVVVPMLSEAFPNSTHCFNVLKSASTRNLGILPLLVEIDAFGAAAKGESPELAYLRSILNRANRVPRDRNFSKGDMPVLADALETTLGIDHAPAAMLCTRLPKLSSLIISVGERIPRNGAFEDDYQASLESLVSAMQGAQAGLGRLPRVLLAHAGDEGALSLCPRLEADLREYVDLFALDLDDWHWFGRCDAVDVCVPLLCREFGVSAVCESRITYAKDMQKRIVPIVANADWYGLFSHA
eukprot:TRINITY_DN19523_c0_g1_i2.p1 TRINITY_DN19523_c0_g1~~TRINITY_DN19523_c0_g1_i2.p1  ORF type:complete len:783 (+),score=141.89 TRINITY_DN19523_c0_g1_i2:319-2667(+)